MQKKRVEQGFNMNKTMVQKEGKKNHLGKKVVKKKIEETMNKKQHT